MTFAAYETLYEGSLVFGNRKAHVAEQGVGELEDRLERLRKKKIEMENKVDIGYLLVENIVVD